MPETLVTETQVTPSVNEEESVTISETTAADDTAGEYEEITLSSSTDDYMELLVYQTQRLDEITALCTYGLVLCITVLGVIIAKWIASIFNGI